ncbi:oxidoreductase-like protein [Perilla frutescens var. hirtella]|nr:oxidoreductase-like protein [Perilla frutescens var. hirtella]
METTTSPFYIQTYNYYSSASSPPPTADLRRFCHHHDVRRRLNLTMPLRDLTLRRIAANPNRVRFNQATESFFVANRHAPVNHHAMAEERKNTDVSQGKSGTTSLISSTEKKDKSPDKSTPALSPPPPPPPEKPLPGDCCGSGCVRCVWDVYYEELEEYNKLCDSKIS